MPWALIRRRRRRTSGRCAN